MAPSGITFSNKGPWEDRLLVSNLHGQQLLVMSLSNNGSEILNVESFLKNEYGRLRDVAQDKDSSIYIATSNRDGRGKIQMNLMIK